LAEGRTGGEVHWQALEWGEVAAGLRRGAGPQLFRTSGVRVRRVIAWWVMLAGVWPVACPERQKSDSFWWRYEGGSFGKALMRGLPFGLFREGQLSRDESWP